jgi:hypothetical protein
MKYPPVIPQYLMILSVGYSSITWIIINYYSTGYLDQLFNYGKSPFSMGKSTINGPFSIANC